MSRSPSCARCTNASASAKRERGGLGHIILRSLPSVDMNYRWSGGMKDSIPSKSSIYTISQARLSRVSCRAPGVYRQFRVSHQTRCNDWDTHNFLLVCVTHTVCCNFHSENSDLSYFVRFSVLADHVHRAKERGSVLRVCLSPAPFCNLQSRRNGAGPFCSAKVG